MFRLILLFTLLPLVELTLLLRIGEWLGAGPTVGLVVLTGIAGAWLARREGVRTWAAVQDELAAGRLPGTELVHALLVLVAGVVLVTPGVLTDAAGLLLLIRPVRDAVVQRTRRRLAHRIEVRTLGLGSDAGPGFSRGGRPGFGTETTSEDGRESQPHAGDASPDGRRVIEI